MQNKNNSDFDFGFFIGVAGTVFIVFIILLIIIASCSRKPKNLKSENIKKSKKNERITEGKREERKIDLPEAKLGEYAKAVVYIESGNLNSYEENITINKSGTGFIFTWDGKILTNNHVIEGSEYIYINFYNGEYVLAEKLKQDANIDLALLKAKFPKDIKPLELGIDEDTKIGNNIMVMGYPLGSKLGSEMTLTKGIISSVRRNETGQLIWYQIDAAVNPGNSGGPLIDETSGKVIGVVTAKINEADNIGFARPIKTVKEYFLGER